MTEKRKMRTPVEQTGLVCSFCGKSSKQVAKLIAGPAVYICDGCVSACNDVIATDGAGPLADWPSFSEERLVQLLGSVAASRDRMDQHVRGAVRELRRRGVTWARIGEVLGMTRQSAWERYSNED